MSIMNIKKKFVGAAIAAAILAISCSGTAAAAGVIYAPGVNVPGQTDPVGPGPGSSADSNSDSSGTNTPGGSAVGQDTAGSDANTGDSIQSGEQTTTPGDQTSSADDIEALKLQSLKEQYSIFKTNDPNIVVSRGRTIDISKAMIALTYDDGPRTDVGARLMNVFEQYGQRTTFFMVGNRVPSRADEVRRMAADGHEVANHTYDHVYLNKVGAETIHNQVNACNDIIEQTCGIRPRIMRLPGGNKNSTVLANINMPIILWNIDTRDWSHRNTQTTIDSIIGKVKDGDIVLMHELYEPTAAASEYVVPQLVSQGFQLVTVSELAELKGKTLAGGGVYYSL